MSAETGTDAPSIEQGQVSRHIVGMALCHLAVPARVISTRRRGGLGVHAFIQKSTLF